MKIINTLIFDEKNGFLPGEIEIDGAFIKRVSYDSAGATGPGAGGGAGNANVGGGDVIDAQGCYAVPGLIDIHLHGCAGHNFYEAEADGLSKMLKYQAENGVTSVCPSTLTLSEEMLTLACGRLASYNRTNTDPENAKMIGVHLEGPFISPQRCGAQNPAYAITPDAAMYDRLRKASGDSVKIIAVAPEIEGALEFIEYASKSAVVSVAHTVADYDAAAKAFKRGASHVTHLYNAMTPLTHRAPNVIGAAFDDPSATVELICDGVHLHPAAMRIAMRLFGPERVVIVSDSMMATGLGDGTYDLGGLVVNVKGKEARLVEGGNIASSVSNLMDCLRVAVKDVGIPLAEAVRCSSTNPARVLGAQDERGRIAQGLIADLVLLDADLNVAEVFVRGRALRRN